MIAANYYGAAIPSATPMAAIGAALLLANIACLVVPKNGMFAHQVGSCSDIRSHAIMNASIILAAFPDLGVRDDVAGRPGRPRNFIRERGCGGAYMACCAESPSTDA